MKDTAETIEFFTPKLGLTVTPYIAANSKQGIHHVGRYQWAANVLKAYNPATVLDIACGAGYGSAMLSTALPDAIVTGGDYDERAVEYARNHYAAPNLAFKQADLVRWTSGENELLGRFDAIVSFDTIEHLLHREIALIKIADNLSDNGALLISTPCAHRSTRLNPGWEHHKIEYSFADLYKFLSRFFTTVIYPQHDDFLAKDIWLEINSEKIRYLNRMNPLICRGPIRSAIPPEDSLLPDPVQAAGQH
jgi:cyclopropane fatty-acyl-phospholipid synthase-like methyltransferase